MDLDDLDCFITREGMGLAWSANKDWNKTNALQTGRLFC